MDIKTSCTGIVERTAKYKSHMCHYVDIGQFCASDKGTVFVNVFFVGLSWSKLLTAINCYCWHHCVSKCVNFTLPILWLMYYEDITHLCVTGLGRTLRQQRLHFHLDMQCLCIRPQETLVYSWTAEVNVAQLASVTKLCFANACCRLALKCYVTNLMFFGIENFNEVHRRDLEAQLAQGLTFCHFST